MAVCGFDEKIIYRLDDCFKRNVLQMSNEL